MKLDHYLHHVISFVLLGVLYHGVNLLSVYFQVAPDAELTLSARIFGVSGLLVLYFVLPLLLYSILKWKLLPQLHVKQPRFLSFVQQNTVLYLGFIFLYIIWNFGGDWLRDPVDIFSASILLVYGAFLLLIVSSYVTLIQYLHKYGHYEKAMHHLSLLRVLHLFSLYLAAGALVFTLDSFSVPFALPLVGLLALAAYTHWQERLFFS